MCTDLFVSRHSSSCRRRKEGRDYSNSPMAPLSERGKDQRTANQPCPLYEFPRLDLPHAHRPSKWPSWTRKFLFSLAAPSYSESRSAGSCTGGGYSSSETDETTMQRRPFPLTSRWKTELLATSYTIFDFSVVKKNDEN